MSEFVLVEGSWGQCCAMQCNLNEALPRVHSVLVYDVCVCVCVCVHAHAHMHGYVHM